MNDESDSRESKRAPNGFGLGRAVLVIVFLFLLSAGIFYATQYQDIPLEPSKETTQVSEPLDSAGRVDFFRAFELINYSDEVSTQENGFRQIIQNVEFFDSTAQVYFADVCEKLGLDPTLVKPSMKYADPYDFTLAYFRSPDFDEEFVLKVEKGLGKSVQRPAGEKLQDWDVSEILVLATVRPWTGDELPLMESWVKENSPVLDLYGRAVRAKTFEVPFSRIDDSEPIMQNISYHAQEFRSIARGYYSRAHYFLGRGELRKAMDDVISCKRMGRHLTNRNTFIDRLVGIAIEGIADSIGVINVKKDLSTKADLDYFWEQLSDLPARSDLNRSIQHEKFTIMDLLQRGARGEKIDWMDNDSENARLLRGLGLDWNIVLSDVGTAYDDIWKSGGGSGGRADVELTFTDYISRKARSKKFAQWYVDGSVGLSIVESDRRATCSDQMRAITLAMLRYEKDHGTLPPAFTTDATGNPLHSWRVLLLPYLGEKELYDKFKLDEPWNSPHNSALEKKCPTVYACPSCTYCLVGQSSYSVVLGPNMPFEAGVGKKLSSFGPDCNDMILLAERRLTENWLDPTKELSETDAAKGINVDNASGRIPLPMGSEHPAGSQFGFRDGSVNFLSEQIEVKDLKNLLRGTNKIINP